MHIDKLLCEGGKKMKKIIALLTLAAFLLPVVIAYADSDIGQQQGAPKIKCCFQDGQCLETLKSNCEYKKGKVVSDCKQCPGVWGQGEKPK
jgi:hypothetical protein